MADFCTDSISGLVRNLEGQIELFVRQLNIDFAKTKLFLSGKSQDTTLLSALGDDIVKAPIESLINEINTSFGVDPSDSSYGGSSFLSSLSKSLGIPNSPESALSSSFSTSFSSIVDDPLGSLNGALYRYADCDTPLTTDVVASMTAAVAVLSGNSVNLIRAGASIVALSMNNSENFFDGLASIAVQTLEKAMTAELALVDELISAVKDIDKYVKQLKTNDYRANEFRRLNLVASWLDISRYGYTVVERRALAGGTFLKQPYDVAEDNLKKARDELWPALPDIDFSATPFKLIAALTKARSLFSAWVLLRQDVDLSRVLLNNFRQNIQGALRLANFAAPCAGLLANRTRCLLNDVRAVQRKNNLITYVVKQKEWAVELTVLYALSKLFKTLLSTADFVPKLNNSVNKFLDEYAALGAKSETMVLVDSAVDRLFKLADRALLNPRHSKVVVTSVTNIAVARLQAYREIIKDEREKVLGFLGSDAQEFVTAVANISSVSRALTGVGLERLGSALIRGDLTALYRGDQGILGGVAAEVRRLSEGVTSCAINSSALDKNSNPVYYPLAPLNTTQRRIIEASRRATEIFDHKKGSQALYVWLSTEQSSNYQSRLSAEELRQLQQDIYTLRQFEATR